LEISKTHFQQDSSNALMEKKPVPLLNVDSAESISLSESSTSGYKAIGTGGLTGRESVSTSMEVLGSANLVSKK
jgi:hypothetical protein